MPMPLNLADLVSRHSPLAGEAVKRFYRQPDLFSAASNLVALALSRLSPPVSLDPGNLALAWPAEVSPNEDFEYLVLPELLIELFVRQTGLSIVPGFQHVFSYADGQWRELSVDLQRLAEELDAVRPSLMEAFEQALAQFWSETDRQGLTHWRWMADYLCRNFKDALEAARLSGYLSPQVCQAGEAVASWREAKAIAAHFSDAHIQPCLLQVERGGETLPFDPRLDPHLLLQVRFAGQPEVLLLFSFNTGLRCFSSTQALAQALSATVGGHDDGSRVHLQRLSVEGDVFSALAHTLLRTQLIQASGLTEWVRTASVTTPGHQLKVATSAMTGFYQLDVHTQQQSARRLQQALPGWLRRAPAIDRWHLAAQLARLAASAPQTAGQWFLENIPTLEAYVYQRLREEAARQYPAGPALVPENIQPTLEYVVQDLISVTGGPWEPEFKEEPVTVLDLAIDNLASHSNGWLKVAAKPGTTLPPWLTGDSLKALIRAIDVGEAYPRLLRTALMDSSAADRREGLFCQQVALQLPMLAWELRIQGKCGMDDHGYRLVEEVVSSRPIEAPARLMGLGVTAGSAYGVDPIAATFLFIRQEDTAAPCVLYRPLHPEPLRQYPTLDALWDDMAAPGELQDEALRWMTDLGRSRYRNGGFREPRVVRFGQGDEFAPLERPTPARPVLIPLAAPVLRSAYQQVVRALVEMAERRTVSNAEDRWISLGQLAQTLFSALLPVLNGPLATAGWLIQLSDAFDRYLETLDQPGHASADARTELLFSIVMLLLNETVHWPIDEPDLAKEAGGEEEGPGEGESGAAADPEAPRVETGDGPTLQWVDTLATESEATLGPERLQLGWASPTLALNQHQLKALARLHTHLPGTHLVPIPHGPYRGLYLYDNQWLLQWQGHFYTVDFEEVDPRILGPEGQPGPYVRRDEAGRWTLDLRLRLRGGGPKRRIEIRRQQNEQDRQQGERLYEEIMLAFEALRDRANPLSEVLNGAMDRREILPGKREEFHQVLREGYEHCAELIGLYDALQKSTPLPDFATRMCNMLARQLHISKAITDNLSQLTEEFVRNVPYMAVSEEALHDVVMADRQRWQSFLERYQDLTQQSAAYVQRHERTLRRIEAFPGVGTKTLAENSTAVETLHTVLELWSSLAYCELGLLLEPLRHTPVLGERVHDALEPLLIHSTSHADLVNDPAVPPEQKLQVLDTAIAQYQRVEDALRMFKQTLDVEEVNAALHRFESLTASLLADAEARMGALIRSTTAQEAAASGQGAASRPRRPRPRPKPSTGNAKPVSPSQASPLEVIHTEEGQALMAYTRTDQDSQEKLAEVVVNGQVLATWRQDPDTGVWRKPTPRPAQPGGEQDVRLNPLIKEANRALDQTRKEMREVARLKQVTRVPADIEDQYHGSARRLEALAERIERALTQLNATDAATQAHGSAEVKARELRQLAARAKRLGTEARIELCKRLMPTAARLAFLVEVGEVTIRRLGDRTPLGRGGRRDFVQEYEVRDRQQHPLWYAHFHYDTATADPQRFTAAHLKTVTQRFEGYQKQLQQARNNEEVIGIYRSRIDPVLARRLFLSLP